jgi:hypothetical protein
MPVLYEHWRPDLNECFYIGISWAQEETRPYDMGSRNYRHVIVQEELKSKQINIEIRIQKFADITLEKLCNLEKLMIAHWKQYIGNRLTNLTKGGEGVFVDWDDELRSRHSDIKKSFFETPEGEEHRKKNSEYRIAFLASPEGEQWREDQCKRKQEFLASPEGEQWREDQKQRQLDFLNTPEGKQWCIENSQRQIEFHLKPEGKLKAKNHSDWWSNFLETPEWEELREQKSATVKASWQNIEFRMKMMLRDWHRSNVRPYPYWGA